MTHPSSPLGHERRRDDRERIVQTGTICDEHAPADAPGDLVTVIDFSLGGVGLTSEKAWPLGSIVRVRVDTNTFWVDSRARVIRCDGNQGRFWIACEFIEEATSQAA